MKKEDKPDLAFSRVGKAGHISFSNIELKSKNTHYFIKLENVDKNIAYENLCVSYNPYSGKKK